MQNIYRVYKKNNLGEPHLEDQSGNCIGIELTKEEAEQYVIELNRKSGREEFICMSNADWWRMMKASDVMDEMDKVQYKYANLPELEEIREELYNNTDKNINGFDIPFIAENNKDYEIKLKEKLAAFIKEIDRPAFKREDTLIDDVKAICQKLIDAFEAAKLRNYKKAEKLISEIIEGYKQYPFAVSDLDKSYAFRGLAPFEELRPSWGDEKIYENMLNGDLSFFRARVVAKAQEEISELDEINYLSYSRRSLSKDMRFSSKGKACLYLGVTSYVCSEECRWNKKDKMYLSSFRFNEKGKKLKILNLVVLQALMNGMIPRDEKNFMQKELHNAMIRVFPLMIATMFTIKTPDDVREEKNNEEVKYEYLISQILMDVLNREGIDGVAYLSRQGRDDFQYPQMVCLAIPIVNTNSENEYGDLINCYEMTKPVLFNENIDYVKKSYINEKWPMYLTLKREQIENYTAKVYYGGQEIFYQKTPFSRMDDYMINQKHMKFDGRSSVKKRMKKTIWKLPKLWQSKDENFTNMYWGGIFFMILSCICFLCYFIANNENEFILHVAKTVLLYLSAFLMSMSFVSLVWGFYVNNSVIKLKNAVWIMLPILVLVSLCALVIGIPFLIGFAIVGKIIEMRAKKIDNFLNYLKVLSILCLQFICLLKFNLEVSFILVQRISMELKKMWSINANTFSCELFIFITICVLESFLITYVMLLYFKHKQNKLTKKKITSLEKKLKEAIENQQGDSIEIKEEISKEKGNLEKINKRDLEYIKNGIKRLWLFMLVIAFGAVTFNMVNIEGIKCHSSDIINVLTIYTLILLYNDKRKEWK